MQERMFVYTAHDAAVGIPFNEVSFLAYTKLAKMAAAAGLQVPEVVSPLPFVEKRALLTRVCCYCCLDLFYQDTAAY
jgi:hypothetical protein